MRAHKNKLDFCSNERHSIVTFLSIYCNSLIKSILLYILFYFHSLPKLQIIYIYFKPETIEYTSNCVPKCNSLTNQNEHEPFCHLSHLKGVFPH